MGECYWSIKKKKEGPNRTVSPVCSFGAISLSHAHNVTCPFPILLLLHFLFTITRAYDGLKMRCHVACIHVRSVTILILSLSSSVFAVRRSGLNRTEHPLGHTWKHCPRQTSFLRNLFYILSCEISPPTIKH